MRNILFYSLLLSVAYTSAQDSADILSEEIQITTAVLPLPETDREGAKVYGYKSPGELVVLREGSNNMVCIADDPSKEGISVACYSTALEPFMARGRELSKQNLSFEQKMEVRGREVEEGSLSMPAVPSMMYVYYGKDEDYDRKTGKLANGQFRYVIYTPFATPESTGLPIKPHSPGMPWLMDPGSHRAHIMVGPFN